MGQDKETRRESELEAQPLCPPVEDVGSRKAQGQAGSALIDRMLSGGQQNYDVTKDAAKDDWSKLKTEVAGFEGATPKKLKDGTSDEKALGRGKILSETQPRADGMMEEMTVGTVNVPYETFIQRVLPADWGMKLAAHKGGDVHVQDRDGQGRAVQQEERMVLQTPMSQYLSWLGGVVPMLKDLDMTKTEEIEYGDRSARVRWRVYWSDNQTVKQDIGYVNFEAAGNQTKITFHSAHAYTSSYTSPMNWGPLAYVRDQITAKNLRDYFTSAIAHYRKLAGG